jgi:hypothetical protein
LEVLAAYRELSRSVAQTREPTAQLGAAIAKVTGCGRHLASLFRRRKLINHRLQTTFELHEAAGQRLDSTIKPF